MVSLQTSDLAEARQRRDEANRQALFDWKLAYDTRPGSGIQPKSVRPDLPTDPALPVLENSHALPLAKQAFHNGLADMDRRPISSAGISDDKAHAIRCELRDEIARYQLAASGMDDGPCPVGGLLAKVLIDANLRADPHGEPYRALYEYLRRAGLQLTQIRLARFDGDFSDQITDAAFSSPSSRVGSLAAANGKVHATAHLSDLISRFDREHVEAADITDKTARKYRASLRIIEDHFGATSKVDEISRDDCLDFRDIVSKLPPNFTKTHGQQADLRAVASCNATKGGKALGRETQTNYLRMLERLLSFAVERGHAKRNEASNLQPIGKRTRAEARRRTFSADELREIFNAPVFTGCIDEGRGFARVGPNVPRRSRFWVPLLGLFTGLRLNEILQLTADHVQVGEDGLPYLLIAPDMQVKTDNGYRQVPLHNELLKIGFPLWVVERRRAKQLFLFDDVPPASDGYRSNIFSKRFGIFLEKVGINGSERQVSFHSFRHHFRDGLRRLDANPDLVREVGGWARSKDTSDIYGDGTPAHVLRPLIEGISYPVDLSHLYADESAAPANWK